jgi:hypothetical protein
MNKAGLMVVLLLGAHALSAQAATDTPPPLLLVRVLELNATGPDNRAYTLFRDETGMLVSLQDIGRITYEVRAGTLPEGGYHTLSVRLADNATAVLADGRQVPRTLRALSLPSERRISGMLWVEGGNVSPLRTKLRDQTSRLRRGGDDD